MLVFRMEEYQQGRNNIITTVTGYQFKRHLVKCYAITQ